MIPFGAFAGVLPPTVYLILHVAAFLLAAYFASRAFGKDRGPLGWAFTLFALGELIYATYTLDLTVLLFAHVVAEVLDIVALILIFGAVVRRAD